MDKVGKKLAEAVGYKCFGDAYEWGCCSGVLCGFRYSAQLYYILLEIPKSLLISIIW